MWIKRIPSIARTVRKATKIPLKRRNGQRNRSFHFVVKHGHRENRTRNARQRFHLNPVYQRIFDEYARFVFIGRERVCAIIERGVRLQGVMQFHRTRSTYFFALLVCIRAPPMDIKTVCHIRTRIYDFRHIRRYRNAVFRSGYNVHVVGGKFSHTRLIPFPNVVAVPKTSKIHVGGNGEFYRMVLVRIDVKLHPFFCELCVIHLQELVINAVTVRIPPSIRQNGTRVLPVNELIMRCNACVGASDNRRAWFLQTEEEGTAVWLCFYRFGQNTKVIIPLFVNTAGTKSVLFHVLLSAKTIEETRAVFPLS